MKRNRLGPEMTVGIVLIVAIALLFYMSLRVERFGFLKDRGYDLLVYLDHAGGLDTRSTVQLAGVAIGRVKSVSIEGLKAKVVLRIREDVKIPVDSVLVVKTEGVLGERYIDIIPGKERRFYTPGSSIEQKEMMPSFDEVFRRVEKAATSFEGFLRDIGSTFGEKERTNIKKSLENIRSSTEHFSDILSRNKENIEEFTGSIKRIVKEVEEGKGTLGLLLKDDTVYWEAKEVIGEAKEVVQTIKTIAKDVDEGKGSFGKFLKDDSIYTEAKEALRNIKEVTETINKGEGTLGKLTRDDELYKEAKKTLKEIQRATEGIQEMTPITVIGTLLGILF